jgi:anti-anti-sigma regulatory factor
MHSTAERSPNSPDVLAPLRIELAEVLDMRAARLLKDQLTAALDVGGTFVIDASRVRRVSTGCVQIIAAFFNDMRASGHEATLWHPTDALSRALHDLGLEAFTLSWKMEH